MRSSGLVLLRMARHGGVEVSVRKLHASSHFNIYPTPNHLNSLSNYEHAISLTQRAYTVVL